MEVAVRLELGLVINVKLHDRICSSRKENIKIAGFSSYLSFLV
jgi:hypothetical protein